MPRPAGLLVLSLLLLLVGGCLDPEASDDEDERLQIKIMHEERPVFPDRPRPIRFRSGPDATTRYGTGYGGGTIEVRSRNR